MYTYLVNAIQIFLECLRMFCKFVKKILTTEYLCNYRTVLKLAGSTAPYPGLD